MDIETIARNTQELYHLDTIVHVSVLKERKDQHTLLLLETKKSLFVLEVAKTHREGHTTVENVYQTLDYLSSLGLPVPYPVAQPKEIGRHIVAVQTFIPGRHYEIPNYVQSCAVAAVAARQHRDTTGTPMADIYQGQPYLREWEHILVRARRRLAKAGIDAATPPKQLAELLYNNDDRYALELFPGYSQQIASKCFKSFCLKAARKLVDPLFWESLEAVIAEYKRALQAASLDLNTAIVHGDINVTNVLFKDSEHVSGIIDYEWTHRGYSVIDAMDILEEYGRNPEGTAQYYRYDYIKGMISIYHAIRPFTPEEFAVMPVLIWTHQIIGVLREVDRFTALLEGQQSNVLKDMERKTRMLKACIAAARDPLFLKSLKPSAVPIRASALM